MTWFFLAKKLLYLRNATTPFQVVYIYLSSSEQKRSSLLPVHQEAEALVGGLSIGLHTVENCLEIAERTFEILCSWAIL